MKTLEIIFHGGLGNQLFQLYYAMCLYESKEFDTVVLNKRHLVRYDAPRDFELDKIDFDQLFKCSVLSQYSLFSIFRLPKLIKIFTLKESPLTLFNTVIIDGYFQNIDSYASFSQSIRLEALEKLAGFFETYDTGYTKDWLHHIRLGDGEFSLDYDKEIEFIDNYFCSNRVAYVMTDKEGLVAGCKCHIIPTNNLTAYDIICTMGGFKGIKTNGSTLALWAAVLFDKELKSNCRISEVFFNSSKKLRRFKDE
jgi:hypothetical protein